MPTKMYFNYDNDKKVYVVPVLPEELQIKVAGQTNSVTIDQFGELINRGKRDAISIKFSSFFPATYGQYYCSCTQKEFKDAATWHKWMMALLDANKPCHFVYTDGPCALNIYADMVNYTAKEVGGDPGTVQYTVELKEHREPTVRKYVKKVTIKTETGTAKKTTTKTADTKRVNNTEKTYKYKNIFMATLYDQPYGKAVTFLPINTIVTSDEYIDLSSKEKSDSSGGSLTVKALYPGSSRTYVSGSYASTSSSDSISYLHVCYNNKWYYVPKTFLRNA